MQSKWFEFKNFIAAKT